MRLFDVNVLLYAHRSDSRRHAEYLAFIQGVLDSDESFGMSDQVLSGVIRIATHPRVFDPPSDLSAALKFANELRGHPHCVPVNPGPRHWEIFTQLCSRAGAKGSLVPDAWYAALAIESGSEWVTSDRDYSRFPGLRWRHPLDG